jgi:hypothetical protein
VGRGASADRRLQGSADLLPNEAARPVTSVGKQRAIDFYVITEAISRPTFEGGDLIGIDTFA